VENATDELLDQYLVDQTGLQVLGLVWHEFLSSDPVHEVRWAQQLAENSPVPMAIVGLVDFLAPDLEQRLDAYALAPFPHLTRPTRR
jgi:predicted TIM-barrel fold metal-dependent hydrolase